jgi:hypothetical protein
MTDMRRLGDFSGMDTAPADGQLVIGRSGNGEEYLMRWRSPERILKEDGPDDQKPAHWARWHSGVKVEPKEWALTELTLDDVQDWA